MAIQVQGNGGTTAEVESATRALRIIQRPPDWGALGSYAMGAKSGTMSAGLSANSPIFSLRYTGVNVLLLRRLQLFAANAGTAFTAGVATFDLFAARAFSASDSGGTAGTLTVNNGKLRTSMGTTGVGDLRIASTGALTPGTRTLDAQQLASMTAPISTTASISMVPAGIDFLREQPGEQPLVLGNNEGLVIQATVPGSGTWSFNVNAIWDELAAW